MENRNSNPPLKIALADDDEDDRMFFSDALQEIGIQVNLKMYNDGQALLEGFRKSDEIPDILFLDLNMPMVSGIEALKEIRNSERFKDIPIIAIYSTSSDEYDKQQCYKLGANAYLTKPSDYNKFVQGLKKIIEIDWEDWNSDDDNFVISL